MCKGQATFQRLKELLHARRNHIVQCIVSSLIPWRLADFDLRNSITTICYRVHACTFDFKRALRDLRTEIIQENVIGENQEIDFKNDEHDVISFLPEASITYNKDTQFLPDAWSWPAVTYMNPSFRWRVLVTTKHWCCLHTVITIDEPCYLQSVQILWAYICNALESCIHPSFKQTFKPRIIKTRTMPLDLYSTFSFLRKTCRSIKHCQHHLYTTHILGMNAPFF